LTGEESALERGRPSFQIKAKGLLVSNAGGGGDEPPRVGLGLEVQARLQALLEASLQPSIVSVDDSVTYKIGIFPSSAGALSRGELCGVDLCFGSESLTVTVDRSSLPKSLCTPAASANGRAFTRRFVHRFSSARGTTHTGDATLRRALLVRGARASAQEEGSRQYQVGAATSCGDRPKSSCRESMVTERWMKGEIVGRRGTVGAAQVVLDGQRRGQQYRAMMTAAARIDGEDRRKLK
jgi:hypothetical protein